MKFNILNRFTGKVQFTAEIEADESTPNSIKLGLAVKWAIANGASLSRANLSGANLSYVNLSYANLSYADLSGANLTGANLSGANLSGANFSRADLSDANLSRANLSYADLSGANLSGADLSRANLFDAGLVVGGIRSDGYQFFLIRSEAGGFQIRAGCRVFNSFQDAAAHWKKTRGGTVLGKESLLILNDLKARAKVNGWKV